jgi:hypothetical protein
MNTGKEIKLNIILYSMLYYTYRIEYYITEKGDIV